MSMDNKNPGVWPVCECTEEGRTIQSAEAECNINNIMAQYNKTGDTSRINAKLGEYRDLSGIPDLHEAMTIVAEAKSLFTGMPIAIRQACDHNVANYMEFALDPENKELLEEYDLYPGPDESKPVPEARKKPLEEIKNDAKDGIKDPKGTQAPEDERPKRAGKTDAT